jgi:hypothetical protein
MENSRIKVTSMELNIGLSELVEKLYAPLENRLEPLIERNADLGDFSNEAAASALDFLKELGVKVVIKQGE